MRRRRFLPSLVGVAVAGCGRKGRQPRKLRVGLIPRLTLAPVYLADELGFFREAGLEVEFRQVAESVQMLVPLAGGDWAPLAESPRPVPPRARCSSPSNGFSE